MSPPTKKTQKSELKVNLNNTAEMTASIKTFTITSSDIAIALLIGVAVAIVKNWISASKENTGYQNPIPMRAIPQTPTKEGDSIVFFNEPTNQHR